MINIVINIVINTLLLLGSQMLWYQDVIIVINIIFTMIVTNLP